MLTALTKSLLKRTRLSFKNYNLKFQSQRRRRIAKERLQALKLTGLLKKIKSCLD
jgi:hypothetical protein